jgi:PPOX class probable F420-dependent enzyme
VRLEDGVRALLERPNFVHVATVLPDGGPHSVAVWAGVVDGDRVAFFTQPGSRKARNLERDPRVAMSVVDHEQPYRTAYLRGRVVQTRDGEAALAVMDELSIRHTGKPFPYRRGRLFVCEIERQAYQELAFTRDTSAAG